MKSIPNTIQYVIDANWIICAMVGCSNHINHERWFRLASVMNRTRLYWSNEADKLIHVLRLKKDMHTNHIRYHEIDALFDGFTDEYAVKIRKHIAGAYKWL